MWPTQVAADSLVGSSECEALHATAALRCRTRSLGEMLRAPVNVTSVRRWFAAANTSITAPVAAAVEPGARVRALGVVRDSSGTGIYNREKAMFLACPRRLS